MSTAQKRTTIYIAQDLQEKLDRLKQGRYYKESQSAMIGHLIRLGADVEEKQIEQQQDAQDKPA